MPETIIVNLRQEPCDVKITRTPQGNIPEPPIFGCFGNPFNLKDFDRKECIELFEDYFLKRVKTDQKFRTAVFSLRGKRLGCFCKKTLSTERSVDDLACHGDVIKEWLDAN